MKDAYFQTSFHELLAQQPGMIFYKNHDHIYTAASDFTARLCGFENALEFHGRNDYELRCPATESAEAFRAEDQQVLEAGRTLNYLQLHQYADSRVHVFLMKKSPVRDTAGRLIGVCGFGSEIMNPEICHSMFNLLMPVSRRKSRTAGHSLKLMEKYDQLSVRESQVLFYFMRGFSNKEIGLYLDLSARTIETYLERVRLKFSCVTRSDLQDMCLHQGLIYMIPKSIFGVRVNSEVMLNPVEI